MSMICTLSQATVSAAGPLLNSDDTWVAVGDSITEDGRAQTWVEYYMMACLGVDSLNTVNAGLGGDVAAGVKRRLDWDVLASKPTVATLMLGMNDIDRPLYQAGSGEDAVRRRELRLKDYESNLGEVVDELKNRNVRVVLLSPTPYEHSPALAQPDNPGADDALVRCAEIMNRMALEKGVSVIDVHAKLTEGNREYQREQAGGTLIGPDRIHPGALGQFALAVVTLSGMKIPHAAPFLVIDAGTMQSKSRGVVVVSCGREKDGLAFTATFSTLPFVVRIPDAPAGWAGRLKGTRGDITLRIGGLAKERYQLLADGTECGTFSREELAGGISLGELERCPLTVASHQLSATLRAKAEEAGKLRIIAWSEQAAHPDGRPAEVRISEVEERLRSLQKTGAQSSPETIQRRLDVYGKWKAQESEIRTRIKSLEEKARSLLGERAIRFELRRID
jgi:lysophospholipase L1-like esterase